MEQIISPAEALPGRREALEIGQVHAVNGHPTQGPWPEGMELAWFGMGCFWGVERLFWQQTGTSGVHIPYKGGAPAISDVIAGHADASFQNLNVVSRIFDSPQEAANYEFKVETALTAWARAGGFNAPRDVEVVAMEDGTITLYSPEGEPERKGVSLEKGSSIFRDTMTIPT